MVEIQCCVAALCVRVPIKNNNPKVSWSEIRVNNFSTTAARSTRQRRTESTSCIVYGGYRRRRHHEGAYQRSITKQSYQESYACRVGGGGEGSQYENSSENSAIEPRMSPRLTFWGSICAATTFRITASSDVGPQPANRDSIQ